MKHVSEGEREAMAWAKANTPAAAVFVSISGDQNVFCDATNEWFPALTERRSLTTAQGGEWLWGDSFGSVAGDIQRLQGCIDEDLVCLTRETESMEAFGYVYISIAPPIKNCGLSDDAGRKTRGLVIALAGAEDYSLVYQSAAAVIFQKTR